MLYNDFTLLIYPFGLSYSLFRTIDESFSIINFMKANSMLLLLQSFMEDSNNMNPIGILLVIVALFCVGALLVRKIASSTYLRISGLWWFGYCVFFLISSSSILQSKDGIQVPSYTFLLAELLFLLFLILAFSFIALSYKGITGKDYVSEEEIIRRQRTMRYISYLLPISLSAVPFILHSWGLLKGWLPDLDGPFGYELDKRVIVDFVRSGCRISLLATIVIFIVDNLLSRLASEILVYNDLKDLNKFCLYLRSFSSDVFVHEPLICKTVKRLYPIYAIGDPNKVFQPNGAQRIYVSDDIWNDAVNDLSVRSKLIILRVGQTEGTIWEIENVIKHDLLKKVIFIAYTQEDYCFFSDMINEKLCIAMPSFEFVETRPVGFYFIDVNNSLLLKHFRICCSKDVENMLNQYLMTSPELDREYADDLDLRKHNLKYMFDKSRIPESVRHSLNWGIISPAVNMRHWSLLVWGIFVLSLIASGALNTLIPAYAFVILAFLLGNRIEWAARGWASATLFLRHQRREAKFLHLSFLIGILYSLVYIILDSSLF